MKKATFKALALSALLVAPIATLTSCSDEYDDTDVKSDVAANADDIATLESTIATLQTALAACATDSELSALETALEASIADLEAAMEAVDTETINEAIETAKADIAAALAGMEADMEEIAAAAKLEIETALEALGVYDLMLTEVSIEVTDEVEVFIARLNADAEENLEAFGLDIEDYTFEDDQENDQYTTFGTFSAGFLAFINPIEADLATYNLSLVDSQGGELPVEITAVPYEGLLTVAPSYRAASENGIYEVTLKETAIADPENFAKDYQGVRYAFKAAGADRTIISQYDFAFQVYEVQTGYHLHDADGTEVDLGEETSFSIVNPMTGKSGEGMKYWKKMIEFESSAAGLTKADFTGLETVADYDEEIVVDFATSAAMAKAVNSTVTFTISVLNYNGSVETQTYTVTYSDLLYEATDLGTYTFVFNTSTANNINGFVGQVIAATTFFANVDDIDAWIEDIDYSKTTIVNNDLLDDDQDNDSGATIKIGVKDATSTTAVTGVANASSSTDLASYSWSSYLSAASTTKAASAIFVYPLTDADLEAGSYDYTITFKDSESYVVNTMTITIVISGTTESVEPVRSPFLWTENGSGDTATVWMNWDGATANTMSYDLDLLFVNPLSEYYTFAFDEEVTISKTDYDKFTESEGTLSASTTIVGAKAASAYLSGEQSTTMGVTYFKTYGLSTQEFEYTLNLFSNIAEADYSTIEVTAAAKDTKGVATTVVSDGFSLYYDDLNFSANAEKATFFSNHETNVLTVEDPSANDKSGTFQLFGQYRSSNIRTVTYKSITAALGGTYANIISATVNTSYNNRLEIMVDCTTYDSSFKNSTDAIEYTLTVTVTDGFWNSVDVEIPFTLSSGSRPAVEVEDEE